MRRCVWSRNLKNEEAMARVGPQRHRKQNKQTYGKEGERYGKFCGIAPENDYFKADREG